MRLVIVSYRLPFRVLRGRLHQNAGGLVSAVLAFANGSNGIASEVDEIVWIGASDHSAEELAAAKRTSQELKFRLIPVDLPEKLNQNFYGGFCNDLIWPLFHYFPSISSFEEQNWLAYQRANHIFAEAVRDEYRPDDRIWIHDYHFMLLPALVRELLPAAHIGYFLHIPFPSFEVIRQLPRSWLHSILKGLLGANLIGLHTYDYVQHFSNTVMRTLRMQAQGGWFRFNEFASRVEAFPIGIDARGFHSELTSQRTNRERNQIRKAIGDRIMMFSVDRMDYSKGLLSRLEAFELFLNEHPEWKEKITFNMVVVPSRDTIVRYQKLRKDLEAFVGRINGLHGTLDWRPVAYQYRSLSRAELVALYDVAKIGLITPRRDGMNLVAKEFIACQPDSSPGVLILSEMAGAASELREALLVNPNDRREIADAILKALQMPIEERKERWSRLRDRVFAYDVFAWAQDFLQTLDTVWLSNRESRVETLMEAGLVRLQGAWAQAQTRYVFLDYDGTLVPFNADPQAAVPSPQLMEILGRLLLDSRNHICIISGRNRDFLDQWFGGLSLTLVSEHGAFIRRSGEDWRTEWVPPSNWHSEIRRRMHRAAQRCLGSTIEEKSAAVVWHYRNADPVQGLHAAQELEQELSGILSSEEYVVVPGNCIVEVRPRGINKGQAARSVLNGESPDFIVAVGDDRTDEDLFAALPEGAYAIKVGTGNTRARFHLKGHTEVLDLLSRFVRAGLV